MCLRAEADVFSLVAAVLALGDVAFTDHATRADTRDGSAAAALTPKAGVPLGTAAALFGVGAAALEACLCERTLTTREGKVTCAASAGEATAAREGLVKARIGSSDDGAPRVRRVVTLHRERTSPAGVPRRRACLFVYVFV